MALKEGDFVYLDFTGRIADDGQIFDTTVEDVAKKAGLRKGNVSFEPLLVRVGSEYLLPALDKELIGKEPDAEFTVELAAEDAFGKKRADHLKLMPLKAFQKQKVNPAPGMEVSVDNVQGTVKSVTGNRVVVDFNHPLAGKAVTYEINLKGIEEDLAKQAEAVVGNTLGFAPQIKAEGTVIKLELPVPLPDEVKDAIEKAVLENTAATAIELHEHSHE